MFKRRLIAADQASVFMAMTSVHISSGLVLHQMTSDHNRSELRIQDHSMNSQVQSWFQKLFLKQSRQLHRDKRINPMIQPEPEDLPKDNPKLEIAVLSSQAVNKSPTHYPCDSARTFRVILFSIHNDEWKSFQCHHQTALRRPYALSWKPCQGDSLNLPDHRIHKDGDGDASFQLKSDSLPHAHAQTTKTFYKHQDSRIMKAQEIK
ncbi:hypothetical protein Tco_1257137 [Tanacetum coccineum]